jgi:Cysteine-rich CWC
MNQPANSVDPKRCPLCGNANQCGMTTGSEKCWCFTAIIGGDVLARVAKQARDSACICEQCAQQSGAI